RLTLIREGQHLRQHPAFAGLHDFDTGPVDLAVQGGVGVDYQQAFIFHRSFSREQVPRAETWNELLETLLDHYQQYVEEQVSAAPQAPEEAAIMTLDALLPALYSRVTATGFRYPRDDFEAFCIALKSKP